MTDDFIVRPGAADAVLAAARARRLRRALATAAVALGLGVVPLVLVTLNADGRDDSLTAVRPELSPTPSAPISSASPLPAASASATGTPDTTPAPGTGLPSSTSDPRVGSGARPQGSPSPVEGTNGGRPVRRSAAAPISRTTSTIETSDLCDAGTTDTTRTGWCSRYTGPSTATRGRAVVLSFELCRYPQAGDARVDYDSGLEIQAEIAGSADQSRWRAGQGVTYGAQPHGEVIRAGTCVGWSASWDTRDQDGFLVVPGDYQFRGGINNTDGLPGAAATLRITS